MIVRSFAFQEDPCGGMMVTFPAPLLSVPVCALCVPAECACVSLLSVPVCAPSRLLQRPVWFDNNISCGLSGQQKHSSLSRLSLRSVSRLRRNIHISNYGCYPLTRHGFRSVFRVEILCLSRMERGECCLDSVTVSRFDSLLI